MSKTTLIPTASHWGNYLVEADGDTITAIHPYPEDPNPTPIGQSLLNSLDKGARIPQPMVRAGYLKDEWNSDSSRRGMEPFVPVSWGKACELAADHLETGIFNILDLRNRLQERFLTGIDDTIVNGAAQPRLPNTLNVSFKSCASGAMVQELDERGIAVSAHSACHSGDLDPSHVLRAMQVPETHIHGTLRISLSRFNTIDEVDELCEALPAIVAKSRQGVAV